MPITFESIQDPYGIGKAGSLLGSIMMQRSQEELQNQRQLELEQRQLQRQLGTEERQFGRQQARSKEFARVAPQLASLLGEDEANALVQLAETGYLEDPVDLIKNLVNNKVKNLSASQKSAQKEEEALATHQQFKGQGIEGFPDEHIPGTPAATYRTLANIKKPEFEKESDKRAAIRSDEAENRVIKSYRNVVENEGRLNQQLIAAKSGKLPTPLMVKTIEKFGFPLSILGNPLAEGYDKNVNENIKGISDVFRGAIRVAEIEPYMRTIPTLMNSDKGKEIIIKNQMLDNEARKAEYKAYKDILKENKGKLPPRLDTQILDRTESILNEIADKKRMLIEDIANVVPTQRLYDPEGNAYDIPTKLVPEAIEKNGLFYRSGK